MTQTCLIMLSSQTNGQDMHRLAVSIYAAQYDQANVANDRASVGKVIAA